jgi:hypothetical protein
MEAMAERYGLLRPETDPRIDVEKVKEAQQEQKAAY